MSILEWYRYVNYEIADPRTNDWWIVNTPLPVTIITVGYLYFVLKLGPEYMKNRPAYSCKTFIVFYNFFQIVANAWLIYLPFQNDWHRDYFLSCVEVEYSPSPKNLEYARIVWFFLLMKIVDYIETILFVLKKKQSQITVLHLYHHIAMVAVMWVLLKYFVTGIGITFSILNCAVHVIMYSYYLLTGMGPRFQETAKKIKRWVTIIQIAQLSMIAAHTLRAFYPGCPGIEIPAVIMLINAVINLVLFLDFYKKTYTSKTKRT